MAPMGCTLFLSTPSARRATFAAALMPATTKDFYPRPPRGGRRSQAGPAWYSRQDFYPRPPRGGRPKEQRTKATPPNFYPRPPRGGRHRNYVAPRLTELFLSTPSARRATAGLPRRHGRHPISIHALREEGDHPATERPRSVCNFYPRPPRGGRRYETALRALKWLFLSTPSARRATAKTETKSLFSNKLYNILHEFRRALIYNGSKNYPNHAK